MLNGKAQLFVEITTIRRKRMLNFDEIVPTIISALSQNEEYTPISHFNYHKREKKALSPGITRKRRLCCDRFVQISAVCPKFKNTQQSAFSITTRRRRLYLLA
eukprot:13767586-Ditylum_brightwellii.AAC.1